MNEKFSTLAQIIFLTLAVAGWQIFLRLPEESDTYFVMNLGRYILEHGFPHVDPFTIHENLKLVPQQWLSGIFFLEVFKNFGFDGLRFADFILGAATVLIYWRLCLYVSGRRKTLSFVLSLAVGIFVAPSIVPRPQIISTLLLLIEVFFLEKFTRSGDAKFLIALPLVSIALINFHAAMWLMSLVICLPFLFVKNFRHAKFLLAAMAGIFLCGFINPYGAEAMTYVFRSYGVELISENIPEMRTPTAHDWRGKIFYFSEALLIISLAKFKIPLRYIFLSGGITLMAIMHARSLMLFYFVATIPLAYVWKDLTPPKIFAGRGLLTILFFLLVAANTLIITQIFKGGLEKISLPLEIFFFIAAAVVVYNLLVLKFERRLLHPAILPQKNLSLFITALIVSGIFVTTLHEDKKESAETFSDAIKFLLRSERPENISLYVNQGIGGLAGMFGVKYYIDSRSEVFIDANNGQKNILAEYIDLTNGRIYYRDFFSRYKFTHIILTSEDKYLYEALRRDKNFRVIYESERVEGYKVIRCKVFVPREEV